MTKFPRICANCKHLRTERLSESVIQSVCRNVMGADFFIGWDGITDNPNPQICPGYERRVKIVDSFTHAGIHTFLTEEGVYWDRFPRTSMPTDGTILTGFQILYEIRLSDQSAAHEAHLAHVAAGRSITDMQRRYTYRKDARFPPPDMDDTSKM